jgi:CheY-like chemotaxis protein
MYDVMTKNERRKHVRGRPLAAAVVSNGCFAGSYRVEDLSAGGALLAGAAGMVEGDHVSVLLQVGPPRRCTFTLLGRVVRAEARGDDRHAFAIAFRDLERSVLDLIEEVVIENPAGAPRTVLVVDDSRRVCAALRSDLVALGWDAHTACTPMAALARLDQLAARVDTVIVDHRLGGVDGLDLLTFLTESHPHVRRVLMSSYPRHWQLDWAISSGRAHALLHKPWTRANLQGQIAS